LSTLLEFALGSFIIVLILLFYYNRISKSNAQKDKLESTIYELRDILLQSKPNNAHVLMPNKTTSIWVKGFIFIIIFIVAFTPLYELLEFEYFV